MAARKKKADAKKSGSRRRMRGCSGRIFILSISVLIFVALLFSVYLLILYLEITSKFAGRIWEYPSKIYSDAQIIYSGEGIPQAFLVEKLKRMGYSKVDASPQNQGQFRIKNDGLEIYLRDFEYPLEKVAGRKVKITFSGESVDEVYELNPFRQVDIIEMEPEVLATFHGNIQEERTVVKLKDIPDHLLEAVICTEDIRFFKHHGVDIIGILRALLNNLRSGRIVEGGSTITQQLVKNLYLTEERTLSRKIKEAIMALILEAKYPKDRIIQVYMNEIYLGQRGPVSICGFGEASRFYFGKSVQDLNLSESAMLAGMIKSPRSYNPFTNFNGAVERRNHVLSLMLDRGMIKKGDYERATAFRPVLAGGSETFRQAPYFVDFLKDQLMQLYSEEILQTEGLRIFTTLDPFLQTCAERTIGRSLSLLEKEHPRLMKKNEKLEACLVSIQQQTGNILAMVGGRNYQSNQFNRVTQAKRQPGSLFKPFVYLTGFIESQEMKDSRFTAATPLEDKPYEIVSGGKLWAPENYDGIFRGEVAARDALENSINVPTARMASMVGLDKIVEVAKKCGVSSPLKPVPSIALGSEEVTPLEMAEAYSSIANLGKRATPLSIKDVVNMKGKVIEKKRIEVTQTISPQAAYLITDILRGAVERGTARSLREYGFYGSAAGKTGTTNNFRDSWFTGFTPEILTLTWTGFDSNDSTGLSGASGAMRIWADYMKSIGKNYAMGDFAAPDGLIYVDLDARTLKRATEHCPEKRRELFIEGTEPKEYCSEHGSRIGNWFRKLFGFIVR